MPCFSLLGSHKTSPRGNPMLLAKLQHGIRMFPCPNQLESGGWAGYGGTSDESGPCVVRDPLQK